MPSEPKTVKREHSDGTISVMLALHSAGKSHTQIANYIKIPKSTIIKLIH